MFEIQKYNNYYFSYLNYNYLLYYLVIFIIIFYVFFIAYFRLKHKFWAIQPVFHFHNIKYWLFPPGIIHHNKFPITKYYDPLNIETYKYADLTTTQKSSMYQIIKTHYLREKEIDYIPTSTNIYSHFKYHNHPCYVSFYNTYKQFYDNTNRKILYRKTPLCVLTSRPLYVSLYNNEFICNYVDYLCVNKSERKKNIAPKTIYTYAVDSHKQSDNIVTYLFKREGELTSIVPLVAYNTNVYNVHYWKSNVRFPMPYKLTYIQNSNSEILLRNFTEYTKQFKCAIYPNITNIKGLIKNKILLPFIIHNDSTIVCIYLFKQTCVFYNKKRTIDLVASILVDKQFLEFFQLGFQESLSIIQREHPDIGFVNIENLSNNNLIINHVHKKYRPMFRIPSSYYFYNFATRPLIHTDVFIVN